jgi:hypothetical protein
MKFDKISITMLKSLIWLELAELEGKILGWPTLMSRPAFAIRRRPPPFHSNCRMMMMMFSYVAGPHSCTTQSVRVRVKSLLTWAKLG